MDQALKSKTHEHEHNDLALFLCMFVKKKVNSRQVKLTEVTHRLYMKDDQNSAMTAKRKINELS